MNLSLSFVRFVTACFLVSLKFPINKIALKLQNLNLAAGTVRTIKTNKSINKEFAKNQYY